jgi:4,5-DOPA dioxygenase extradiol
MSASHYPTFHKVYVNTSSFYGFPDHFYKAQYPNKGSPELASKIMVMLSEAGIQSYGMKRGLDHGVFSGFHVGTFV